MVAAELTEGERAASLELARTALGEDLDAAGDITTAPLVSGRTAEHVTASFVAREPGVVAGTRSAADVYALVSREVEIEWALADGDAVGSRGEIGTVAGPIEDVLAGERTALNFLCHLSGVATLTAEFAERIARVSPECRLRDTRKTLPGLRALEKAAVRAGGGVNHRAGLSDGILLKDNHLAIIGATTDQESGAIASLLEGAISRIRDANPGMPVEVEADTLVQVEAAAAAGADAILCDNMAPHKLREAVDIVRGRAEVEASGGITLENAAEVAASGVDYIAVGALTHSAPALDIGLDIEFGDGPKG